MAKDVQHPRTAEPLSHAPAVIGGVGFSVAEADSVAETNVMQDESAVPRRIRLPGTVRQLLANRKATFGLVILLFFTFLAVAAPLLVRSDPSRRSGMPHEAPSLAHPLGTTRRGQDVLDQMIVGTRATLGVGVAAGTLATLLAVVFGLTAGYFGGVVDDILSLLINVVLIIPALPLVIVLASFLNRPGPLTIALVLGFTSWAWGARVLRAQMLTLRGRDFVASAQMIGEPVWRILFVEILPNMVSLVVSGLDRRDPLRGGGDGWAGVYRFGQLQRDYLGDHAFLGAKQRCAPNRSLVDLHPARGGDRAARLQFCPD